MRKKRTGRRSIALMAALCMLLSLMPSGLWIRSAQAAGDLEVRVGTALIGNLSHGPENAFINFQGNKDGFIRTVEDAVTIDYMAGDIYANLGSSSELVIDVAANPTLRALAQSGHAKVDFGWAGLAWVEECKTSVLGVCVNKEYQGTRASITFDNERVLYKEAYHGGTGAESASRTLRETSKIVIRVDGIRDWTHGKSGARGLYVKFKDETRPTMTGYTFTGSGVDQTNPHTGQKELYVKENENITLSYHFSEQIKPTALSSGLYEHFSKHPLFTNPEGEGMPGAGQTQYLKNITYPTASELSKLSRDITFRYNGVKYHNSGNNPLKPLITGTNPGVPLLNMTLEEKFKQAVLADAAGNVVYPVFPNKATNASNPHLAGKTVDPFDFERGGYKVIVDAVAPKYSKTSNGIQPEILTGVVLNGNDYIDFSVQFTEEAIIKRGWDINRTYLRFNNGMKAYYIDGNNTDKWVFRALITDAKNMETPLLKVIELAHDNKTTDTNVISDYAGNLLIQPANLDGTHVDGDVSLVNSKIDKSQLSIDNTEPVIGYRYENGGATGELYKKFGKITIDANDPQLTVPIYDPVTGDQGAIKPSKGIYRPSNMTGAASPAVGLVYYYWSRSSEDPFAAKTGDHFAAVKRYSLSGRQPSDGLYPNEGFEKVRLSVVNNKTNLIPPPAEALLAENSGKWYLHTWTADMTWDSARELTQHGKMKTYIERNPAEYERWKAELPSSASDQDRVTYANNKALAKVGQYGDISVWPLDDFKQADSNWAYNKTVLLLDNKAPNVTILTDSASGNHTSAVTVPVTVEDPESGVKTKLYQWVKDAQEPKDSEWEPVTGDTLSTLNKVMEDGSYWLYIKTSDQAGNEAVVRSPSAVTVNSQELVEGSFDPQPNGKYVQSHDVEFRLKGIGGTVNLLTASATVTGSTYGIGGAAAGISAGEASGEPTGEPTGQLLAITAGAAASVTAATYGVELGYAFSTGIDKPEAFIPLNAYRLNTETGELSYLIPKDSTKDGVQYIHVKANETGSSRLYYFSRAYYFDNRAPEVTFSRSGSDYPQPEYSVAMTVAEEYSREGLQKQYQWVKGKDAQPEEGSWLPWPETDRALIKGEGNDRLLPGETADFRLYVQAVDGAGNAVVANTSGSFKLTRAGGKETPPASSQANLVHLYGDTEDGFTAIVKLDLDTPDKTGYEFSTSSDYGASWVKWRPYTNYVAVPVQSGSQSALRLLVKFKTPGGAIGEAVTVATGGKLEEEPVYALTTLNTVKPVKSGTGVDITVTAPPGIKVTPAKVNPSEPTRNGQVFHVNTNGFYAFDLIDTNNPVRTAVLYAVVANMDDIAPHGEVEILNTGRTSGNVTVQLVDLSEPVRVTNNNGRSAYTFTQNDTFEFVFEDEAGNEGRARVTVDNIDKEAPRVKVVRSYTYGENNSKTFATIRDGSGNVLYSSGVTLEVQKADAAAKELFFSADNPPVRTMAGNGTASFLVSDFYGNLAKVEEKVDTIISEGPQADAVRYAFINEDGSELPADRVINIGGQPYAQGRIKVTVTGRTVAANKVYAGITPAADESNLISGPDGAFAYSRIFSANGTAVLTFTDLLGNVTKLPVEPKGLDNKAPELKLKQSSVGIVRNKEGFDFRTDLGGYTVSDNVSAPENIDVSLTGLDLGRTGRQTVVYTARDQVGNTATAAQDVYVTDQDGLLIFANGVLISGDSEESAIFDSSKLTFRVSQFNLMDVKGQTLTNQAGTFEMLYQSGLYREGQTKNFLAGSQNLKELKDGTFTVTFAQPGWYTLLVRNQERERVYGSFFISRMD